MWTIQGDLVSKEENEQGTGGMKQLRTSSFSKAQFLFLYLNEGQLCAPSLEGIKNYALFHFISYVGLF